MTLHIQLLGGFKITDPAENSVAIHQPRLQLLMAYLVLHHHTPQLRSHLAYLFWPDSSEGQARTNLRKLLHTLRTISPAIAEHIHLTSETVQWRMATPSAADVPAFEAALAATQATTRERIRHLSAATELYRGPLLPGHYGDWVLLERERLHLHYVQALLHLAELQAEQGDLDAAIATAQRLIQADALQESAHRLLMRLYLEAGELAAALRAYHVCAGLLEEELGVEPGPETHTLYLRILRVEDESAARPNGAGSASGVATREGSAQRQGLPLAGRREEWRQLRRIWQEAQQEGPRLVVLQGEAGIGKTRLAEEMTDLARKQGYGVLRARAYAAEGRTPYGPVGDLLRNEAPLRALQNLPLVWQAELLRIVPELAAENDAAIFASPLPPMTEAWQQRRFHEALVRGCLALGQPLVIHLDDLQWFDAESLGWLHFLLRYDPRARLLVVGTLRNDELETQSGSEHGYHSLRQSLLQSGVLVEMSLPPLTDAEVAHLAGGLVGRELGDEVVGALYRATEGNPLFVMETLRSLDSSLLDEYVLTGSALFGMTPKVQGVILGRLDHLSTTARQLLRVAAVIGRHFTFELLEEVTNEEASPRQQGALVHVLDELWQRRIIRAHGPHAYDFSHDRIRETVYAEISPIVLPHLHEQVAHALCRLYAHDLGVESSRIAQHFAAAGRNQKAAHYYRRAAQYAAERFANAEALEHLQRALELIPPADLAERYDLHMRYEKIHDLSGITEKRTQNLESLTQVAEEMVAHAMREDDDLYGEWGREKLPTRGRREFTQAQREALACRAEASICWAHYYTEIGDPKAAEQASFEALALAVQSQSLPVLANAHNCLGWVHYWRIGDMQSARQELELAADLANQAGMDEFEAVCLEQLSATGMYSGMSAADILDHLHRAHAIFVAQGNLVGQVSVVNKLGYVVFAQGEGGYEEAMEGYRSSVELCNRMGALSQKAGLLSNLGIMSAALGEYDEAATFLDESLAISGPTGDKFRHALSLLFYAELHTAQGHFDQAIEYSDASLALLAKIDSAHRRTESLSFRGYLHYLREEPTVALPLLEEAVALARSRHDRRFEATALTRLGHVYLALDRLHDAHTAYGKGFALRQELQQFRRSLQPLAGLALTTHLLGNTQEAGRLAGNLLSELNCPPVEYTEEVFQSIAACYQLLCLWDDPRAAQARELVCTHLSYRSRGLSSEAARREFYATPQHRPFLPGVLV